MTVQPRRSSRVGRVGRQKAAGAIRGAVAALATLCLLLVGTACGTDAQTLQPYTPAEGVNVDVGDPNDAGAVVHVRNLLIISKTAGSGILSASIVTAGQDRLTGVSGTAIKIDGSDGSPLAVTVPGEVPVANSTLVVLTDRPTALITIKSVDLAPGLSARVTLQFEKAGAVTQLLPVVDGNEPHYATIGPAAAVPSE